MNRPMLMMIGGAVLSFASLAVVHEYGPGECSREARTRTELGAALREEAEVTTVDAVPSLARTCWSSEPDYASGVELERAEGRIQELERQLASAATRMHYQTSRAEAVTPDGRIATLAVTADGQPVNELQFVDADIAAAFSGCIYLTGTPTQVQLARDLRRFYEDSFFVREATVRCPACAMLTRTGDIRPCPGCGGESPWVLALRAIIAPRATQATDDAEGPR